MSLTAFAHGVALSLGLIVALGPQNVFVFQQGAAQPRFPRALPTVVTAGLADTLLIGLAVLGVSLAVLRFAWLRVALYAAGFAFLVYVGWTLYTAPVLDVDPHADEFLDIRGQVGFTLSVSLLNPHAILDTVGVIGTNALAYTGANRTAFAVGCVLVSWVWFTGLAGAGRALGAARNADRWLRYLNPVAAALVWLAAAYMAWQLLAALGLR